MTLAKLFSTLHLPLSIFGVYLCLSLSWNLIHCAAQGGQGCLQSCWLGLISSDSGYFPFIRTRCPWCHSLRASGWCHGSCLGDPGSKCPCVTPTGRRLESPTPTEYIIPTSHDSPWRRSYRSTVPCWATLIPEAKGRTWVLYTCTKISPHSFNQVENLIRTVQLKKKQDYM